MLAKRANNLRHTLQARLAILGVGAVYRRLGSLSAIYWLSDFGQAIWLLVSSYVK